MAKRTDTDLEGAYALKGPDGARKLYSDWAETYETEFAGPTGYQPPQRIAERFQEVGGDGPVLDVGCGTGLVADHLPRNLVVDGVDISPEMLARARAKGRYRNLIEADLTAEPMVIPGGPWNGLISAGTFTHGHVPPTALHSLMSLLAPGAIVALAVNASFAKQSGFFEVLSDLERSDGIAPPSISEAPIFVGDAPAGHASDEMLLVTYRTSSK